MRVRRPGRHPVYTFGICRVMSGFRNTAFLSELWARRRCSAGGVGVTLCGGIGGYRCRRGGGEIS